MDTTNLKPSAILAQIFKNETAQSRLREGEVVEAIFLKRGQKEAYFDLGKFGTGIVYGVEFLNAKGTIKNLEPGQKLPTEVLDLDGESGYTELSIAEAGKQRLWQEVADLQEAGEIVKMKIAGANSGGLLGSLNDLRAFLPVSQLSNDHYSQLPEGDRLKAAEELKKFIGVEMNVKVLTVNPRANKLIVSEREIMNANMKDLLTKYEVGQVVDGIVSGLADFGIFIKFADNPQIEGLVHISEIDHRIIDSPKEVAKMGEAVKVKIIDIKENRVFLSMKALKTDPWAQAGEKYKAGEEVQGRIYKYNPFGATIDLDHGLQGMIHVSEYGSLDELKKNLELGKNYAFHIESVKPEERRIALKVKK